MVLPFFSPLGYVPETAGPQGDEKPSGKGPPSDSDPLNDGESGEKYASLSSQFAAEHGSQIPIPETQSAFHRHAQRSAFRGRDARQQALSPVANH